jgi:hypothetical protein
MIKTKILADIYKKMGSRLVTFFYKETSISRDQLNKDAENFCLQVTDKEIAVASLYR